MTVGRSGVKRKRKVSDKALLDGLIMLLRSRTNEFRRNEDIERLAKTNPKLAETLRREWDKVKNK